MRKATPVEEDVISFEAEDLKLGISALAVKPQFYESVITEIKDKVTEDKIVITIAPGKTLAWLEEKFGKKVKIVRTMPNTPAMVMYQTI